MARIRTLKPEFWQDEKLAVLPPLTRLVFLGLVSQADDAGRLVDNVKLLDGLLFPYTEDTCDFAIQDLAALGRIIRYRSESGQPLIQVANWDKHQKVKNPSQYTLPAPSPERVQRVGGESGEGGGRVGGDAPADPETPPPQDDTVSSVESGENRSRVGGESNAPTYGHDPRSPIPDPRSPTDDPREDGRADRKALEAEMMADLQAFAEQESNDPDKRRVFLAKVRGIAAGEDYTAWEDGKGDRTPWEDRPRLMRLAIDRVVSKESDTLRGALRWVVPQQMDPDRQRPAIQGEAHSRSGPVNAPVDTAGEMDRLRQEHPELCAEVLAEFERYDWWAKAGKTFREEQMQQAIREKLAARAVA